MGCLEEVTSLARRLSRNAADADDLVQGAFERAFRSWRDLRQPRACRAWLFQIARNLHLDRQRATSSGPELHLVDEDEGLVPELVVPAEVVERLAARDLESALQRLPLEQRHAVLLCDLWGFEYAEIASITGWPIGTVRSRIARGRAKLASLLAAWSAEAQGRRQ
jgi:RNA polymerase sigma-70 factor (ECF subfamily)